MSCRYLAIVRPSGAARAVLDHASDFGLIRYRDQEDFMFLVEDSRFAIALGEHGAIMGEVFDRGTTSAMTSLKADEHKAILASNGRRILERYWGSWIAFIRSDDGTNIRVIRAPLGDLPCLHRRIDKMVVIASDLALLERVHGAKRSIDWTEVLRHLAAPDIRGRRTCLVEIDELQGGDCIDFGPEHSPRDVLWSPWMFVDGTAAECDPVEAQCRVRDAVNWAIAARSSRYERVLLRLSGGLDSSIVAASLARAGRDFVALNMITDDRSGDESGYARQMAHAVGCALIERLRSVHSIDPSSSLADAQPRPSTRLFMQDSVRASTEVARAQSADIVFDGGGGDNVFCHIPSASPVADRLKAQGVGWSTLATVMDVSVLHRTPISNVLWHGLRHAIRRSPQLRRPSEVRLLSRDAARTARSLVIHPWLNCPRGAYPGKARHVALLVSAQSWVEGLDMTAPTRSISPLLAQPVVEACLAIPSWMWMEGGRDRAIARQAFRHDLPPAIVNRAVKSAPDSYLAQIVEHHGSVIRDILLGGRLVAHGLADRTAVESAMRDTRFLRGYDFLRILQLVDVEAWVRSTER